MQNPLTDVPDRKWNLDAMKNAQLLFRYFGVNIVVERRSHPSLRKMREMREAGASFADCLKLCAPPPEVPTGFILWNKERDAEELVYYLAECSLELVNDILHASTCGCEGCWSRMRNTRDSS